MTFLVAKPKPPTLTVSADYGNYEAKVIAHYALPAGDIQIVDLETIPSTLTSKQAAAVQAAYYKKYGSLGGVFYKKEPGGDSLGFYPESIWKLPGKSELAPLPPPMNVEVSAKHPGCVYVGLFKNLKTGAWHVKHGLGGNSWGAKKAAVEVAVYSGNDMVGALKNASDLALLADAEGRHITTEGF